MREWLQERKRYVTVTLSFSEARIGRNGADGDKWGEKEKRLFASTEQAESAFSDVVNENMPDNWRRNDMS